MTTSTPPAWHWLDECDVPIQAYQWMTPKTPSEAELSTGTPKAPVAATLGVQNDSDQCANGEQCPPSALIPSDQCPECRAAPGQPHATGCEGTAQLTDAQSCAVPEHPDCDVSGNPVISCDRKHDAGSLDLLRGVIRDHFGAQATVGCESTAPAHSSHETASFPQGDNGGDVKAASCPECGTVTDIEYEDAGPDTFHVPFKTQEFMFEELAPARAEYLHDILDDHSDLIIEMARDRFRDGYKKYGSAAYQWDAETRLTNVLEELADSVVYLTTGAIELAGCWTKASTVSRKCGNFHTA